MEKPIENKYIVGIVCASIALIIMSWTASAETLDMDTNTCVYHPEVNKDFCKTEYTVNEVNIDTKKIQLTYADMSDNDILQVTKGQFYLELPYIDTEIKLTELSKDSYIVEVSGWKSPLLTIDNVLCYDGNCHFEYALWNGTYAYRNRIYGNASVSLPTLGLVPINITLNSSLELFWCNFLVSSTNDTIGFVYWNNYTDYICVNTDETTAVATIIDEGNGTNYKVGLDGDLMGWYHLNGTDVYDSSLYENIGLNNGCTAEDSIIGNGLEGLNSANFNVSDTIYSVTVPNWTISFWAYVDTTATCRSYKYADANNQLQINFHNYGPSALGYIELVHKIGGVNNIKIDSTTNQYPQNTWFFFVVKSNGTAIRFYVNDSMTAYHKTALTNTNLGGYGNYFTMGDIFSADCNISLDDVRYYNRTLSDDETALMFDSQLAFYSFDDVETNTTTSVPPTPPNISAVTTYCYNSTHLYVVSKDLGNTGVAVYNNYFEVCQHGCTDESWTHLGNAACEESPIFLYGLTILIIVICVATGMRALKV